MLRLLPTLLLLSLCAPLAAALSVGSVSVDADVPVELPAATDARLEASALPAATLPLPSFVAPLPLPTLPLPAPAPIPSLPVGIDLTPAPVMPPVAAPPMLPPEEQAVATAAAGSGLLALLAALYSRLAPNQLLDHERRDRILAIVRAQPGIGPQDVGAKLGTSWGVTQYHLDKLEKGGLLTSQRKGHHRCYFVPGAVPREQQGTVALFRVDTTRRVAELIAQKPGLTQTQLCAELGISASAMSKQVARLEGAGVLRREAADGPAKLFPISA
jgi:DNA-binding MarR family transcriptional regulator